MYTRSFGELLLLTYNNERFLELKVSLVRLYLKKKKKIYKYLKMVFADIIKLT